MSNVVHATPSSLIHDGAAGRAVLSKLYLDDDLERIRMVRSGLPARIVQVFSDELDVSKEAVYALLGVTRATATRLSKTDKNLGSDATERAVFISGLVKAVEDMIPGDVDAASFDASKWVARWLEEPQPALHGETPASFLDTADGRRLVRKLLGQMESGVYA